MLAKSTIGIVDKYWSSSFGLPPETLYKRHTLIVPDDESNNFHGIYCFLRNQALIVAVSRDLLDAFYLRAESWSPADILDQARLRRLIDYLIDRIIGPAFIGYTGRTIFPSRFCRGSSLVGRTRHRGVENAPGCV